MRALILGGTAESRELALLLLQSGWRVTSSLAGRVKEPKLPLGEVRIGGFGGPPGLARWLMDHEVDLVVDATHPFAEKISISQPKQPGRLVFRSSPCTDRPGLLKTRRVDLCQRHGGGRPDSRTFTIIFFSPLAARSLRLLPTIRTICTSSAALIRRRDRFPRDTASSCLAARLACKTRNN